MKLNSLFDSDINLGHEEVLMAASKLLRNKIFSGVYKERRLIEVRSLAMYRDVIVVDKSEYEFNNILRKVDELFKSKCKDLLTTSISGNKSQYSLWTNLSGVAFGSHWFKIRNITVDQNVVNFSVKYLRSIEPKQDTFTTSETFDWTSLNINADSLKNVGHNLSHMVTKENIIYLLRFILLLSLATITACYQLILVLLQLIHELNFFVRSWIPFFIVCVDNITKAFGGLLILIAMMWKTPNKNTRSYPATAASRQIVPAYRPSSHFYNNHNSEYISRR